nr:GNAT family N-acetyltransferase [uncultured Acetatifactor sp.]
MRINFAKMLKSLPAETWHSETVGIQPIRDDDDLWYATAECRLYPEQEDYVNPAGFSIGRAWLNPDDNLPCIIRDSGGKRIGYIILRKWLAEGEEALNWSFYLDRASQGMGFGRAAAKLAVKILKTAAPDVPIKLSAETDNVKAQRLYLSIGFVKTDEMDGDDFVFRL